MSRRPPAPSEYAPRSIRSGEFFALLQSPGVELYEGRLYQVGSGEEISRARSRLTTVLRAVLNHEPWTVLPSPDPIQLDDHNALMADIVAAKGTPVELRTLSIVVEFEREGGFDRYRGGRHLYLDKGVFAHWLVEPRYRWVEIAYRSGRVDLYNTPDQAVPVVVDDLVMGEFSLGDLLD